MEPGARKTDVIDFTYHYTDEDGPVSETDRMDEIQSNIEDQFNFLVDKEQDVVTHNEE
jgi:hypothetical protein